MRNLRILSPTGMTADVIGVLESEPCVSGLALVKGAALRPTGDLVLADLPREAVNKVVEQLRSLGLHRDGTIEVQQAAAAAVGSVSGWRTDTATNCTFPVFPVYLAKRFFRFSWRILEPYGCADRMCRSGNALPTQAGALVRQLGRRRGSCGAGPLRSTSRDQAGLSSRRSSSELSLNWCRLLAAARTVRSASGSTMITVM